MASHYGVFLAAGVAAGAAVAWSLAPRVGITRNRAVDLAFWTVVGGVIGARMLFVILEWGYFHDLCFNPELRLPPGIPCASAADCLPGQQCAQGWCRAVGDCFAVLKFWQGGWVFLGGVLGAIPASALYLRLSKTSQAAGFALLATALPLGHALGRIGCWFRGCCHGKTAVHTLALDGRLPVQLYEAAGDVLIFATLLLRFTSLSKGGRSLTTRQMISMPALYLVLYPVLRFATEMLRGDERRGIFNPTAWPSLAYALGFAEHDPVLWSTSQLISLGMLVVGGGLWVVYLRGFSRPGRKSRSARCGSSPAQS